MRLVDADKFEAFVIRTNGDEEFVNGVQYVLEKIDNAPTVDVQPVVHAKWIADSWIWECSNCKETYHRDNARTYKYCPNCGAKIDWEINHE